MEQQTYTQDEIMANYAEWWDLLETRDTAAYIWFVQAGYQLTIQYHIPVSRQLMTMLEPYTPTASPIRRVRGSYANHAAILPNFYALLAMLHTYDTHINFCTFVVLIGGRAEGFALL